MADQFAYRSPGPRRISTQEDWRSHAPSFNRMDPGHYSEKSANKDAPKTRWRAGFIVVVFLLVISIIAIVTVLLVQDRTKVVVPTRAPPEPLESGNSTYNLSIPPETFTSFEVEVTEESTVELSIDLTPGETTEIVVYARKGSEATHAQYDDVQRVIDTNSRRKRATRNNRKVRFPNRSVGIWFFSYFNAGSSTFSGETNIAVEEAKPCQSDCTVAGHGKCEDGDCVCEDGWYGKACSEEISSCVPVQCSDHGQLADGGLCTCEAGWSGRFCENGPLAGTTTACPTEAPKNTEATTSTTKTSTIFTTAVTSTAPGKEGTTTGPDVTMTSSPDDTTPVAVTCAPMKCSSRGNLMESGKCECDDGWTGDFCEEGPSVNTTCPNEASNDTEASSTTAGTSTAPGEATTTLPDVTMTSSPDDTTPVAVTCAPMKCSSRGNLFESGKCECEDGWTGDFCEEGPDVTTASPCPTAVDCPTTAACPTVPACPMPEPCPTVAACPPKSCSSHGTIKDSDCQCEEGWTGDLCEEAPSVTSQPCPEAPTTEAPPTEPPAILDSVPGKLTFDVAAGQMRCVEFTLNAMSHLRVRSLNADVAISIFARADERPDFAKYDVAVVLKPLGEDTQLEALEAGTWFLCFYNGGEADVKLSIDTELLVPAKPCPANCNMRGDCTAGACQCIKGWMGPQCEKVDRVPCIANNCTNGRFDNGKCDCDPGYVGEYCEIKDCTPPNCNDNGVCLEDPEEKTCDCNEGWKGSGCAEADCVPSDCNDQGTCVGADCVCEDSWQGDDCSTPYIACPGDCHGHGACDNITGVCTCRDTWVEPDCSTVVCTYCSEFGTCNNGTCVCVDGWLGPTCRERSCSDTCLVNGICKNGTCECRKGWDGDDCTIDMCPESCSGHGVCEEHEDSWGCVCESGFEGEDCAEGKEVLCADRVDNDGDGLTDCDDPDCCSDKECKDEPDCAAPGDPIAPSTNTSGTQNFVDKVEFLLSQTQMDVLPDAIDSELVCVAQGKVITRGSGGHRRVKVSVNTKPQFGHALTRSDGRFDFVLNCGGRETFIFKKSKHVSASRTVDTRVQTYVSVQPNVVLIRLDGKRTPIKSNKTSVQEVVGSNVTDGDGSRQVTMFFKPDTSISVKNSNGKMEKLKDANIHITEYTRGRSGEEAMPAPLPPNVAYTYAVEIGIDELDTTSGDNTSSSVVFDKPVPFYLDDFLGFPVGSGVPVGYLNRTTAQWVSDNNGLVVKVLDIGDPNKMGLDVTGSGKHATQEELERHGIDEIELQQLKKYPPGKQLWRVVIIHLTPYDCNFPYGPPDGACSPAECGGTPPPDKDDCGGGGADSNGNNSSKKRRRRKRSLVVSAKKRVRRATGNPSAANTNGLVVFGDNLKPPASIERWRGMYSGQGSADTCAVTGATCGQMYTQDISVQSPSALILTIPGTDVALVYNHFRQPGFRSVISIPLAGPNLPDTVRSVQLEIQVSGKTIKKKFSPKKNLSYNYVWNRVDAFGREVQGEATALVRIGYEYGLSYYPVRSDFQASFNRFSSANLRTRVNRGSKSAVFWVDKEVSLVGNTLPDVGLGGWTLSVHHTLDITTGTLYKGDGDKYTINSENVMKTLAGTGQLATNCQACGEGTATEARVTAPIAVAEGVDGVLYYGDDRYIRKLKDGIVTTLVVLPWSPRVRYFLTINPVDGAVLVSDPVTHKLYTVPTQDPDLGKLQVLAGTGQKCPAWDNVCGDGGLAADATFTSLRGVAVGRDGNIFVVDGRRIRQIGGDGRITNYVGTNRLRPPSYSKLSERYKQPFDELTFANPTKIIIDGDENMHIVDDGKVLRLSKEGNVRIVAGVPASGITGGYKKQNPSGKATEHEFASSIESVALSPSGNLYIAETDRNRNNRVYRVKPDADVITHVAGKDPKCDCWRSNCLCYGGEGNLPLDETIYAPMDVVFTKKGQLVIADQGNRRVRYTRIISRNSVVKEGERVIPDETRSQLYVFNSQGYHIRTLNAFTQNVLNEFVYDEDMKLVALVDGFNRTLKVERKTDGRLDAFVTPSSERTVVTLDGNGMLQTVMERNGKTSQYTYDNEGMVQSHTPPIGCVQNYEYNAFGRIMRIYRGQDIVQEFSKSKSATGDHISESTTLTGRRLVSTRQVEGSKLTLINKFGHTERIMEQDGETQETTITQPNGMQVRTRNSPQGQWGSTAPILGYYSVKSPGGLQRNLEYTEVSNLKTANDPLSATLVTHETRMNEKLIKTVEKNYVDKTISTFFHFDKTKVLYVKSHYDVLGRVVQRSRPWDGLDDIVLTHSENSYLEERGGVWTQSDYDAKGNLIKTRDLDGRTRTHAYNDKRQRISTTLESGNVYQFEYTDCGHVSTVIMPSGTEHHLGTNYDFHKTENTYGNQASGKILTSSFSPDSELSNVTYQAGASIQYTYDEAYRSTSTQFGNHIIVFKYPGGSDQPEKIQRYVDNVIDSEMRFKLDGMVPIQLSLSFSPNDESDADFHYEYSSDIYLNKIRAEVLDSEFVSSIERNEAGHVTKYENFEFTRRSDSNNEMSDGVISCLYKHNKLGMLSEYSCSINGDSVFDYRLVKDPNSTIINHRSYQITNQERINRNYTYDQDGQLISVVDGNEVKETYNYDVNGNRISWTSNDKSHTASYDSEDRVSNVDGESYAHSTSGFLSKASEGRTFRYNAKGELEAAVVDDIAISYRYDGYGRLVGRTVRDESTQYFYGDPQNSFQPSHVAKDGSVMALFYDSRGVLIAMKTTDMDYYVMCDHHGTPLVVFDSNANIVKQMTYDTYGVLLSDSNPEMFMPIGFAGGLYDPVTKFSHFHYRDYVTYLGQWAARDPVLFDSQQPNLYQYVLNDPVNLRDPLGLYCIGFTFYGVWGFGGFGFSHCSDQRGTTTCTEAGVGTPGGGFTFDPSGSSKDKEGWSSDIAAEVSGSYSGPGGGVEGGFKYEPLRGFPNDPCAWSANFKASVDVPDGETYSYEASRRLGEDKVNHKVTSSVGLPGGGSSGYKAKVGAKVYATGCYTNHR